MLAALLVAFATPVSPLPDCSTHTPPPRRPPWEIARSQYDILAEDPGSAALERVRARSSHKKMASSLNGIFFGDENWFAIDALKPTVCGPVHEVEMFGHVFSFDESDVHFTVSPGEPLQSLLVGLSSAAVRQCRVPGSQTAKVPCIFGEVTPNEAYERQLCTPQCTHNGTNYTGKPWDDIRGICVRGPLVLERLHAFRPEVHPAELSWTRLGSAPRWFVMVTRDASQRFDHFSYFAPWPGARSFLPWSVTGTARFELWFEADAGHDPSFTLKPRIGLSPDAAVTVEFGASPSLPPGLTADVQYVCRESATRLRGRLSVGIAASQRGEKNKGGRNGESHAVALEIVQGGPATTIPSYPGSLSPKASPVPPPPMELVALARIPPRRDEDGTPYRVELDAILVADPASTEGEHYAVEELNVRRHPDEDGRLLEGGKRPLKLDVSFSTHPPRRLRAVEVLALQDTCRRKLVPQDAVLVAFSVNGQVDLEPRGDNLEKGPVPHVATPSELAPETAPAGRPLRRPGVATVDICAPGPLELTLEAAVSTEVNGKPLRDKTSVRVTRPCAMPKEILQREGAAVGVPADAVRKLIHTGERVLTLVDAETEPGDDGAAALLARASYALASSMAADCPQELSRRRPGARDVLQTLMKKYAFP